MVRIDVPCMQEWVRKHDDQIVLAPIAALSLALGLWLGLWPPRSPLAGVAGAWFGFCGGVAAGYAVPPGFWQWLRAPKPYAFLSGVLFATASLFLILRFKTLTWASLAGGALAYLVYRWRNQKSI